MTKVETIRGKLAEARARLVGCEEKLVQAREHSSDATPGGLRGPFDHGVLTRPRSSRRAEDRRYAAYDREAAAYGELREQGRIVASLEKQLERAEGDAKAPCDLASLKPGDLVRDRWGWHKVVRVNGKSVSVETGYSWTERIALDRIIETRSAPTGEGSK